MPNWKEHGVPFEKFTEEITQQWIDKRFNYEECAKWLEAGLEENEVNFAQWLRDEVEIDCERFYWLTEDDEEFLREKYAECLENEKKWQNIHPKFTSELKSKWKRNSLIQAVKKNKQLQAENEELKEKNCSLQLSIERKEEELKMEREEAEKALEKAKEWRERQIKEITEQKDREIKQLQGKISELKRLLQTKIEIPPKK